MVRSFLCCPFACSSLSVFLSVPGASGGNPPTNPASHARPPVHLGKISLALVSYPVMCRTTNFMLAGFAASMSMSGIGPLGRLPLSGTGSHGNSFPVDPQLGSNPGCSAVLGGQQGSAQIHLHFFLSIFALSLKLSAHTQALFPRATNCGMFSSIHSHSRACSGFCSSLAMTYMGLPCSSCHVGTAGAQLPLTRCQCLQPHNLLRPPSHGSFLRTLAMGTHSGQPPCSPASSQTGQP